MTLTINDTTMTSDQTPHTARHAPSRNGWEVSWLPGRILDRNSAITAMVLADTSSPTSVSARATGSGRTSRAGPPNSASPEPTR